MSQESTTDLPTLRCKYSRTLFIRFGKHTNYENVRSEVDKKFDGLNCSRHLCNAKLCESLQQKTSTRAKLVWAERPETCVVVLASLRLRSLNSAWVGSFFKRGIMAGSFDVPTCHKSLRCEVPMRCAWSWLTDQNALLLFSFDNSSYSTTREYDGYAATCSSERMRVCIIAS